VTKHKPFFAGKSASEIIDHRIAGRSSKASG
jgi:hypothetical protein